MCWKCDYMKKYNGLLAEQHTEVVYKQKLIEAIVNVIKEVVRSNTYLDSKCLPGENLKDDVNLLLEHSQDLIKDCKEIQFKANNNAKFVWAIQTANSKEEFEVEHSIIF